MPETIDTVVIGAGHAGLAMSHTLREHRVPHVVVERDSIGSSWRQRWASFHMNTPNAITSLPGARPHENADGFMSRDEWLAELDRYTVVHDLPVRTGVEVTAIRKAPTGYAVDTGDAGFEARNVILCSGDANRPRVPNLAADLPESIEQLHSSRYDRPETLPPGGVLVVGSGQSGVQIAEDLLEGGRRVWLCTSAVARAPRRYRGRDVTQWAKLIGLFEQSSADVPAAQRAARQALISGTHGGHSISLHSLANDGATLLGRLTAVDGSIVSIGDDLLQNVEFGDQAIVALREGLDKFIAASGTNANDPEPERADERCPRLAAMAETRQLDLADAGISTVVWATGYSGDFSYLPAEFLDDRGHPVHTAGVIAPGLYCLGFNWLRRRVSGLIAGIAADAEFIAGQLLRSAQVAGRAHEE